MNRATGFIFGFILMIPFGCLIGVSTYKSIQFNIHCGGHLKRASDANTVETAKAELNTALMYMESHGMTDGTTSVLWETPANDVGFWHKNIEQSYQELQKITDADSQMTKTNTLMKLRETLLDHDNGGDSVTAPGGIAVFPNNVSFWLLGISFALLAFIGFILCVVYQNLL